MPRTLVAAGNILRERHKTERFLTFLKEEDGLWKEEAPGQRGALDHLLGRPGGRGRVSSLATHQPSERVHWLTAQRVCPCAAVARGLAGFKRRGVLGQKVTGVLRRLVGVGPESRAGKGFPLRFPGGNARGGERPVALQEAGRGRRQHFGQVGGARQGTRGRLAAHTTHLASDNPLAHSGH